MKFAKQTVLVGVLLVVGAAAIFFARSRSRAPAPPALADGTQIIVQAITYGTNHHFVHGSEILGKIQQYIPLTRRWLPPLLAWTTVTGEELLVVAYSAYDPRTEKYVSPQVDRFTIIDDHGCAFLVNQFGGPQTFPGFAVSSAYVRVFPRRQKTFTFRMKFQNYPPIDLQIANPLYPMKTTEWEPEPLPITRKTNNLAVTLKALRPNQARSYISADFDIYRDGVDRGQWYFASTSFRDATGNSSIHALCPYERAWKVDVDLYKNAKAPFPESAIWRVPNLAIPKSGESLELTNQNQIGELKIKALALCGAGEFSFSNEVVVSSAPWQKDRGESISVLRPGQNLTVEFRSQEPSLFVRVDGWRRSTELLIRARALDGGLKTFDHHGGAGMVDRYELDKGSPGERIDVEFIAQQPIHFEFTVQPPRP